MYSNFTFKNYRQIASKVLMTVLVTFIAAITFAQPYNNGPLSTGATATGGTAAPVGYTWSELQGTNTGLGSGANIAGGFTLADDFVVPVGQTWNVSKITFFAYSTGYAGATSPFNDTRVQIFNTNPSVGTPTPVFGNLTTNRFLVSSTSNMYRIGNGTPGTTREIWKIEATVTTSLAAGTYWVEWQHGTIAAGASNFSPAKTVVGQPTQAGNNSLQHTITGNTWAPIADAGGPQDQPFIIDYVPVGAACTAVSPGATTSTPAAVCSGIPFSLSVATPGTGIGLVHQWQRSNDNITYTDIAGATSPTLSTTQTAATWYRLRATCGANAPLFSTPVQTTMSTNCYCVPSTINCGLSDDIRNVTFAGINNTSACTTGGYTNYTASVAAGTPFIGASNPIKVTVGPGGTEHVGVWIDYNQNGTFDAAEFTYLGSGNGVIINGNITIPPTALLGTTRMRVRVQWNTAVVAANSCTQPSTFGEVEDYNVNIIPCIPVNITTQPTNASALCGGSTTFTIAATGSIPTYAWQYRAIATSPWVNIVADATYSNVNTSTLTVVTSTALNGYQYRALVSGACSGLNNSNAATLTVNPITAIVSPTSQSICSGANTIVPIGIGNTSTSLTTTYSSAANLALAIPENGTGVTNVVNAALPPTAQITDVKVKFNITHTWVGDLIIALKAPNGQVYNLAYALNGTGGVAAGTYTNTVLSLNPLSPLGAAYPLLSAGATPYTNTFKADGRTAATATPLDNGVNVAVRPTGPTGFTATTSLPADIYGAVGSGNGGWTLALYDFYDDGANGGNINRLVNWSMDITYGALANGIFTSIPATPNTIFTNAAATIAYDGVTPVNTVYVTPTATTTYNVAVNTGLCTTNGSVVVSVNSAPVGTLIVAPVSICNGKPAVLSFTGLTSGTGLTYQWQVSTASTPAFTNIAGATAATYTIANPTVTMSGNKYRVIVSAAGCVAATALTSNDAVLTVNPTPVVTISAAPITKLFPGLTSTLTAAVSPTAATTYQWVRNGANVAAATGNRHVVNIDGLGSYSVIVTDVNGCSNSFTTPASITISDSATKDILFIYPSPNTGKFQVRYYFADNFTNNTSSAYINVYDEKGARVFTRQFTPGLGYGQMNVDLGTHGKGVYRVDLLNANGERLKTGSAMVF
jgi:GEVED domain/Proprotein convertase P-domain